MDRQPLTDRLGDRLLAEYGGAAAAYSLRALNGNGDSVVRVRRESDNNEKDFTASQVSSGEMVNWVNEQITPPLDLRELTATGRDGPIIEAAAAYSLRNLSDSYTGSVVEVRRSSDNAVRSFTATEVSDGTLEDWVSEEQDGWNVQPTWDVSSGDGVISSQSSTATTSTFSITTTSGDSFVRQSSKPNHVIASSGDQVVANITLSGFDAAGSARLRTSGTNTDVAQQTLSNGTADYTFNLTGSAGYFAFVNIEATSGATLTFNSIKVIGKSGYVSKWYDQSTTSGVPNANHAVQADAASQPKIVDGGSLVAGGIDFDGADDQLDFTGLAAADLAIFSVVRFNVVASQQRILGAASGNSNGFGLVDATTGFFRANGGAGGQQALNATLTTTADFLYSGIRSSNSLTFFTNGTASAVSTNSDTFNANSIGGGTAPINGKLQEIIIYNSDQTDNRTALEANIGEVYGISGIPAYEDTVNGFVETWYDQSGNGNDATQSVAGNQPKIVDAGVLVSGGLDFDGVDDSLGTNIFTLSQQPISKFAVGSFDSIAAASYFIDGSSDSRGVIGASAAGTWRIFAGGTADDYATSISLSTNYLASGIFNGASTNLQVNGSNLGNKNVGTDGLDKVQVGSGIVGGGAFLDGKIAEIIVYPYDQSANRLAIEANINNQYDIY